MNSGEPAIKEPCLVCFSCSKKESISSIKWRCECGSFFNVEHSPNMNFERDDNSLTGVWRYRDTIPINCGDAIISMGEGGTPLPQVDWLGRSVYVKLDMLFPTGSYKDRGATGMISRANHLGVEKVVEDSSGNAGCSVAAYCAACKIPCDIFVPASTSKAKLGQIDAYGATLRLIDGSREDVAAAAGKAAMSGSAYYASHVWDPFFFQGTKTFAYEVYEQLQRRAPDTVVIPTGNGTLLIGAYLGFEELHRHGLISKIPRLIAVQADRCAPIHLKHVPRANPQPWKKTAAEGIAIAKPVRIDQILSYVEATAGEVVAVDEQSIVDARNLAGEKGLFIEPTSATALAALEMISFAPDETVVVPLTGHGLK